MLLCKIPSKFFIKENEKYQLTNEIKEFCKEYNITEYRRYYCFKPPIYISFLIDECLPDLYHYSNCYLEIYSEDVALLYRLMI